MKDGLSEKLLLTIDHKYLELRVSQMSIKLVFRRCVLKFLVANSSAIVIFALCDAIKSGGLVVGVEQVCSQLAWPGKLNGR